MYKGIILNTDTITAADNLNTQTNPLITLTNVSVRKNSYDIYDISFNYEIHKDYENPIYEPINFNFSNMTTTFTSVGKDNIIEKCYQHIENYINDNINPNVFPYPDNIMDWSPNGINCDVYTGNTQIHSPYGGIPMEMKTTAADAQTNTYNSSSWNLASASSGDTWHATCYIKGNRSMEAGIHMFGANSSGSFVESKNTMITLTTDWQKFSMSDTFTDAATEYIQIRFEGPDTYNAGDICWFDGCVVKKEIIIS